jgi:hypothetical protein
MRLLKDGPVQTWMAEEDGKTIFRRTQDCTPIVEQCAQMRAVGNVGSSEMRWAGRIPAEQVEEYCNTHGITFREFCGNEEHVKRYMNNPDHKLLRIWTGRL